MVQAETCGPTTAGIYYWWNGFQPSFCVATILRTECPLCAKSRHGCASPLIQRGGQTSVTARANICDLPIRGANRFSAARTKLQERSARQRPSRSTWCSGGPLAIRGFSYGWSLMRPEVCVYVLVDHHAHRSGRTRNARGCCGQRLQASWVDRSSALGASAICTLGYSL